MYLYMYIRGAHVRVGVCKHTFVYVSMWVHRTVSLRKVTEMT